MRYRARMTTVKRNDLPDGTEGSTDTRRAGGQTTRARAHALVITLAALGLQLQAPDAWCWRTTLDGFDPYALTLDSRTGLVLSGTFGNIDTPLGFGVVNATRSGSLNWRHVLTRRGNAIAAAVDAAGDIVTAGFVYGRGDIHFTVAVLSRADGSERWRAAVPGGDGIADAVAVLDDGSVVAGGGVAEVDSLMSFTVVRLSGSTGAEIWRRSLGPGSASGLAVDPEGNIVAAGEAYRPSRFTVVKLAASDGAVLWQQYPADLLYDVGQAIGTPAANHAITTDAAGDVVACGLGPGNVVKFAGADGATLWRATFAVPPDMIAVDATSDVFVTGATTMAKLSGQTGAELWHHQDIPADGGFAARFVLDSGGDVIAAGFAQPPGRHNDLSIMKLAASTGDLLWSQTAAAPAIAPPANGRGSLGLGSAVAIDAAGAFLPVGLVARFPPIGNGGSPGPCVSLGAVPAPKPTTAAGSRPSLTLFGVRFSDRIAGRSLHVRERSSGATLVLVSSDPNILAPAIGSLGDPTRHGALLEIRDETAGTRESLALPASGWRASGRTRPEGPTYRYHDAAGASGPCRDVVLQSGTLLTARCAGGTLPISFDEAGARIVGVTVTLPESRFRYCLRFAGTVSGAGTRGRHFTAGPAPAPATCPAPGGE